MHKRIAPWLLVVVLLIGATARAQPQPQPPRPPRIKQPALFAAGLTLLVAAPVASLAVAASTYPHSDSDGGVTWMSINAALAGSPHFQLAMGGIEMESATGWCRVKNEDCDGRESLRTVGWLLSGAANAAGIVMTLVAIYVPPRTRDKSPFRWSFAPVTSGGVYVNAAGRF